MGQSKGRRTFGDSEGKMSELSGALRHPRKNNRGACNCPLAEHPGRLAGHMPATSTTAI
ncbi:MAG: hypothetical protein ACOX4X_00750 [Aminobacterium colombiense]|uniref:hypothetical protein n=1 Tax=Aminobacterium colombiense TaxID=81468 RepID=UPI003D95D839